MLEHVAGGWAFRASAAASEACARLFEKPVEKGLSQAALETLAIVAYLGPVTRPEIARIRGVNVDGVIAGLAERGLIAEGGRENEFGAIRYRTTPLFERIFGLESLAALPRVDDLGADVDRDPRAARSGRREAPRVRTSVPGTGVPGTGVHRYAGVMFWFSRNRFRGSYICFVLRSRSSRLPKVSRDLVVADLGVEVQPHPG